MFDIDIVVPMCGRFAQRIEDFKKYGLLNIGDASVRLNLVVSNEKIEGLDRGWGRVADVRVIQNESSDYVANLYRFYLSIDPSEPGCRWFIRLDDDSCTDVSGLIGNLDRFYEYDREFCLGDLHPFRNALNGSEGYVYGEYSSLLGEYEHISGLMRVEIECGVMSRAALKRVLSDERSRGLIEKRASLSGGYGDCVVALASAMAHVYPIDCPFLSHEPLLHEFSLLGGFRNHIHMISRGSDSENFSHRISPECFDLLVKVADSSPTELESRLVGKRLLFENEAEMRILEFREGYRAKMKLSGEKFNWYEQNKEIVVLENGSLFVKLKSLEGGEFICDNFSVSILNT